MLAEAETVPGALQGVMRAVCEAGGWDLGRYFRLDAQANVLRFGEYWCADPSLERFRDDWRSLAYAPGRGLVGMAWASGEPLWSADVTRDPRVAQAALARAAGVRGALVFPVAFEHRGIGVLAISSREVREPDERLLRTMRVIGSQLGQFLTRKDAESALRQSEARFRRLTELSSDWYWEQDAALRFVATGGASPARGGSTTSSATGSTASTPIRWSSSRTRCRPRLSERRSRPRTAPRPPRRSRPWQHPALRPRPFSGAGRASQQRPLSAQPDLSGRGEILFDRR